MNLTIDPEFKTLIPPLTPEERSGLEESLLEEGCRDSIVVWNNTIVDGHNRYEICTKHGIEFQTAEKEFESRHEIINWIIKNQIGRRNVTEQQKDYLIGKMYMEEKKEQGGTGANQHTEQRGNNFPSANTAERIGEQFGVSDRTVKNNADYAEAVDKISSSCGGEQLKQKILSGEIKTRKKEIVNVSKQPKEKQKKIFDSLTSGKASSLSHATKLINHEEVALKSDISNKYRIVYADPPWQYGNRTDEAMPGSTTPETHYPCMSISDICEMPIKEIVEDNAVLFMWTTSALLEDAFKVISSWGFKYKTSFVWDKIKHNMGHYNSVRHEFLLVATRGSCTPDVKKLFDSVVSEERTEHSRKPEVFREIIDTIYTRGRKIELFARRNVEGWDVYGNQIDE